MKKELKDYLHLYIGAEVVCTKEGLNEDLEYTGMVRKVSPRLIDKYLNGNWKPILRPLSSMTEEDIYEYDEIQAKGESVADTDTKFGEILVGSPECFLWLLSKHFDIFGLIDAGLAIDKTKL
jgi:hypothetical protein